MLRVLLLAFVALLACAGSAAAASSPAKQLDNALDRLVAGPGGPPGAISIVQRGATRTVHRAGVAKRGRRAPIRSIDHMRLASTSKAFNGAVALSLVDKGVLSLDDTIAQRLPGLPAAWGPVTLRQLLNHTSGLPDFTRPSPPATLGATRTTIFLPQRHAAVLRGERTAAVPAELAFRYSNSDNIVVALMAEQAAGQPYDQLLGSLLFTPLGLNETSLPDGFRLPAPYMHGYDNEGDPPDGHQHATEYVERLGFGRDLSSPIDLNEFTRAYVGGSSSGGHPGPAAPPREGTLRADRPRRQPGRARDLPVQDPVRHCLRPHRQLPRLHAVLRRHAGRRALGDLLDLRAAHPGHDRPPAHGLQGAAPRGGDRGLCGA